MQPRYRVLAADPPWSFDDELKKMRDGTNRGASSQYPTLDINEIANLRVKELADPDGCVLALWCPSVLLDDGLRTLRAWGFDYKQTYVWVKTKKVDNALKAVQSSKDFNDCLAFGMGRLFRQTHELALIGTRGKVYPHLVSKSERSVCFDANDGHSIKPELLQDALEKMFPVGPKLELFARRKRPGWDCVGNDDQVSDVHPKEDIRDAIKRLLGEVPSYRESLLPADE